ncbi:hypothetical protein BpHYR1_028003 [Brachionus plicatilis]|uniref:Uncharacterized protein n=1 Tax=Brachionus plicatilis TaxID=10195 RepID=A0A3M7RL57_BRAPC|nr:hypothetical protein BpHYR1_028003 [Brachionus plicatilis]
MNVLKLTRWCLLNAPKIYFGLCGCNIEKGDKILLKFVEVDNQSYMMILRQFSLLTQLYDNSAFFNEKQNIGIFRDPSFLKCKPNLSCFFLNITAKNRFMLWVIVLVDY